MKRRNHSCEALVKTESELIMRFGLFNLLVIKHIQRHDAQRCLDVNVAGKKKKKIAVIDLGPGEARSLILTHKEFEVPKLL